MATTTLRPKSPGKRNVAPLLIRWSSPTAPHCQYSPYFVICSRKRDDVTPDASRAVYYLSFRVHSRQKSSAHLFIRYTHHTSSKVVENEMTLPPTHAVPSITTVSAFTPGRSSAKLLICSERRRTNSTRKSCGALP